MRIYDIWWITTEICCDMDIYLVYGRINYLLRWRILHIYFGENQCLEVFYNCHDRYRRLRRIHFYILSSFTKILAAHIPIILDSFRCDFFIIKYSEDKKLFEFLYYKYAAILLMYNPIQVINKVIKQLMYYRRQIIQVGELLAGSRANRDK